MASCARPHYGVCPMTPTTGRVQKNATIRKNWRASASATEAYLFTLAERESHAVDKLDYSIRRLAIADHPSRITQSPSTYPIPSRL
jgi:hypothetical protein